MPNIISKNPATNKKLQTHTMHSASKVKKIIKEVDECYQSYKKTSFDERAKYMMKAADVLEKNKKSFAQTMTDEMGKTLASSIAEVEKCAWVCRYYAANAAKFLADELIETDAQKSLICYRPMGVILAVMPWNYPFWQVFRFAAPTLMAGNTAILKHASNVPQSALNIEKVFVDAGFPENAFKTLLIKSDQVEAIIENDLVKAVTLTGSEPAGAAVASTAAKQIKKSVLELGGSDPYVVLEDADIELAVSQCVESRLLNAGQSCIGAKRFIVVEEVYEEFLEAFKSKMESAKMGNPNEDVDLGPMARKDLRDEVHEQVQKSVEKGAKLILGGKIPKGKGAYYPPTILTEVKKGQVAYEEEIFGPVASVIKVKGEKEAIKIANDTSFGLGGCVFTKDLARGERIARNEIESGSCFVNHYVKSDPRLPFGGIGKSGFGRELSYYGIREFVNIKTLYIK